MSEQITVFLTQHDLNYFVCHILLMLEKQDEICVHRTENSIYKMSLTKEVAKRVASVCITRFMEVGIRPDYEPNAEGLQLETLADYFNPAP